MDDIYLSLRNKKLGSLRITGKGNNMYGRATVFCQLTLNAKEETNLAMEQIVKCAENVLTPIIPRENLLNYRKYPSLKCSPVGSVHNVDVVCLLQLFCFFCNCCVFVATAVQLLCVCCNCCATGVCFLQLLCVSCNCCATVQAKYGKNKTILYVSTSLLNINKRTKQLDK